MAEEKYNVDELVPPSFLTEAYIVDVLRQVEDDPELHVNNYIVLCANTFIYILVFLLR